MLAEVVVVVALHHQAHQPPAVTVDPEPTYAPSPTPNPEPASGAPDWEAINTCESGAGWGFVSNGNGFYFDLQFDPDTWVAYGGPASYIQQGLSPPRDLQIAVAEKVLAAQGPGAWPTCFRWM